MEQEAKSQLRKIASDQAASLRILAALESRLDILREEVHRASTIIHRLKLGQDHEKARASLRDQAIAETGERLARIENTAPRSGV